MKVLMVRSDMKLAGPAKLMLACAGILRERGVQTAFASSGGALVTEVESNGFVHHEVAGLAVAGRSLGASLAAARAIHALVQAEGADIVHSFNAHAGLCAVPAKALCGVRIVNTVLGVGKERWNRAIPGTIIAVSGDVRERLRAAGVRAGKIRVVYNATLDDRFLLEPGALDALTARRRALAPVTLCSVAMFTGMKGHERILGLLRDYTARHPERDFRMVFVGDGQTRPACEAMARDYGLSERVVFAGQTDRVADYLDAAHVFVHFPDSETFGMVLAEANVRGLPVLAARVGGIPEVIADGETGYVVPNDDRQGILDALDRLIVSPELRERLGAAGAARAARLFHRDRLGEGLLAAYGAGEKGARHGDDA